MYKRQAPDKIIPLCWVNANEGQEAYDMLEHYLRDENFAGVKMQPLFDAFTADSPMVDPIMELAEAYKKPVFIHCGHPPFSLPWQIGLLAERHPHVPTVMTVSYTHLIRRRLMSVWSLTRYLPHQTSYPCMHRSQSRPVSYTHLDVYKRQVLDSPYY